MKLRKRKCERDLAKRKNQSMHRKMEDEWELIEKRLEAIESKKLMGVYR